MRPGCRRRRHLFASTLALAGCVIGSGRWKPEEARACGLRRAIVAEPAAQTLPVAAVDFTAVPGELATNRARLERLVRRAAGAGARIVVLPEHALTGPLSGLRGRQLESLVRETTTAIGSFGRLARELRVWLALPTLEFDSGLNQYYLTTVLVNDDGEVAARFRKVRPRFERGDGVTQPGGLRDVRVVRAPGSWIGVLSGDDLLEGVARLADHGAGTVLVLASWERSDGVDWSAATHELAVRHGVNLVVANLQAATSSPRLTAVTSGDGRCVSRAVTAAEGTVMLAFVPTPKATLDVPLGLPPPPLPVSRVPSAESVELGRRLFSERRLSRDGSISCATCHDPAHGFTDGRPVAVGVEQRYGTRNTPTLLNSVYRAFVAWDGLALSTSHQVRRALQGSAEMDLRFTDHVMPLEDDPSYRNAFRSVTGHDRISADDVALVLADYVRTLLSGGSAFDRYYYGGERDAIGEKARRGFALFRGKAGCSACHVIGPRYALFSDGDLHNTGVGYQPSLQYLGYAGDGVEVNFARFNPFKGEYVTPSLRDSARTAPYMHDGSLPTLLDVVAYYNRGGTANLFLDDRLHPLELSATEQAQLVAFLETLDGAGPLSGMAAAP